MNGKELNHFEALLVAGVAELEKQVLRRDGITIERSPEQLDEIEGASERLLAVTKLHRDSSELRLARAALRRIEDGSFGTCQECEEDIHPKRLAARPWALLCIRCQEAADRYSRDSDGDGLLAA